MSKRIIEYQGKKYALVSDTEENECDRCALREVCHEDSDLICKQFFTDDEVTSHRLVELMRKRGEEAKAYVNNDEDRVYRREWMQNHQKPEEIEADEVARLNTTIEAQSAEIRELKDQIKRMEHNERMRKEFQPEEKKSWWQRLMVWFD